MRYLVYLENFIYFFGIHQNVFFLLSCHLDVELNCAG